jgi:hypothetical protein
LGVSVAFGARHVDDDLLRLFGLGIVLALDGAMRVEELVGDVGEDGGAARRGRVPSYCTQGKNSPLHGRTA